MVNSSAVLFTTLNNNEITVEMLLINVAIFIIGFLALFLNAFVLDAFVKAARTDPADILVGNLAVTDMLTGVLILYTVTYNIIYFQNLTECLFRLAGVFLTISSSVYHLTLLTIDRFIKIAYPYRYQDIITKRSSAIMSFVVWVVSVNFALMPSYGWRKSPGTQEATCSFFGLLNDSYLTLALMVFLSPVLFMSILYVKIFTVVRRHTRAIAATDVAGTSDASTRRFTVTVVILIGTYLFSFLPMATVGLVYLLGGFSGLSDSMKGSYLVYTSAMLFINSLINPIIYALKLPTVKMRFLRAIGKSSS